jgi:hypothetical protein
MSNFLVRRSHPVWEMVINELDRRDTAIHPERDIQTIFLNKWIHKTQVK